MSCVRRREGCTKCNESNLDLMSLTGKLVDIGLKMADFTV